jgi:tetratricopeptide (TPR) repeat protein
MKKFSLLIALLPLVGLIALAPLTANAQDDAQVEFERGWYDTCYTKKDVEKCYTQSKELINKFPKSTYIENAKRNVNTYDRNKASEKFQEAFDAYYKQTPQDVTKLEALFAAGDAFLQIEPDRQSPSHLYVLGRMALTGHQAAINRIYDKLDKVKDYVERAMTAFESAQASEKTKKDFDLFVIPLKDLVLANGNQFLGFRLVETKGDAGQALEYLTKATQVKGKDNAGWKDPNNYWLRSTIYSDQYAELKKPYEAMTDEQKVSEAGKEILKKINDLLDNKLIPEYARVLATATTPGAKPFYDAAKPQFDLLWKFRTDAPDKAADYIKNYAADPTIANVPVPAKPEDASSLNAPAPTTPVGPVKLQASAPAGVPGGNGAGVKSTTAEKKGNLKGKKRGRG